MASGKQYFPLCRLHQTLVVASVANGEVNLESCFSVGGEHCRAMSPLTKTSKTGLGYATGSAAFLIKIRFSEKTFEVSRHSQCIDIAIEGFLTPIEFSV